MSTIAKPQESLAETLEALRREVAHLNERLVAVEGALAVKATPAAERPPAASANGAVRSPDGVTAETIAVISAALAAFLGVKPHIRQISLVGGASWAQQGRVTIQASHALALQRD